jgi:hypothetical protein
MIITTTQIRKTINPHDIPMGVYSGTITGFIATFNVGDDEYECLLFKAVSSQKKNCQVVKDKDGAMTVVVTN